MSWATISGQIKTVVSAVASLNETVEYMKEGSIKYPIACICPSEFENDYETDSENLRVFAFTVFIRYGFHENTKTLSQADAILRGVVDSVVDAIDDQGKSGGGLLGGNVHMIRCDNYAWGYRDGGSGNQERVAPIKVRCEVLKSF